MEFDISKISAKECYQLLTGAILPRPIAWVSTLSSAGVANLAPFSFFTVASCAPSVLAFTQVNPRDGHEKDTLRNLRETKQCVVNIVSVDVAESMNASSGDYPPEVNEFAAADIAQVPSISVLPPGVAGARVRFECTLREVLCISAQASGGHFILLDVLHIHAQDDLFLNGVIDSRRLDALGKLGGDQYAMTRDMLEMQRPKVK